MRTFFAIMCLPLLVAGCDVQESKPVASVSNVESPLPSDNASRTETVQEETGDPATTAQAQLEQRLKKLDQDIAALKQNVASASTNEEQVRLLQEGNPIPPFVADMMELSNRYPQTQAAVDAMLSAVARSNGEQKVVAMNHLLDNFSDRLQLKKMADQFLRDVPSPETESYILKMIDNAPTPETKAHLLLGYSNYVDQILPFRNALAANPALAARLPGQQMDYINSPRTEQQKNQREGRQEQRRQTEPKTKSAPAPRRQRGLGPHLERPSDLRRATQHPHRREQEPHEQHQRRERLGAERPRERVQHIDPHGARHRRPREIFAARVRRSHHVVAAAHSAETSR